LGVSAGLGATSFSLPPTVFLAQGAKFPVTALFLAQGGCFLS